MTQVETKPIFIQGSNWAIENTIQAPVDSVMDNPTFAYMTIFQILFRVVIKLESLFATKSSRSARDFQSDQFQLFKTLEKTLQSAGIDGKSCLLRTICDMQQHPINHYSIMGEIVTVLMTPKRGVSDFFQEYLEAERIGQESRKNACQKTYSGCPVSLFNLFRKYSVPDDKPVSKETPNLDGKSSSWLELNEGQDGDPTIDEKYDSPQAGNHVYME